MVALVMASICCSASCLADGLTDREGTQKARTSEIYREIDGDIKKDTCISRERKKERERERENECYIHIYTYYNYIYICYPPSQNPCFALFSEGCLRQP